MKSWNIIIATLFVAVGLIGCDGGDAGASGGKATHVGHDHGQEAPGGGDHHGERRELGKVDIGGAAVTVAALGEIEAGHEAVLDVNIAGAAPAAVRAWIGDASAEGSLKAKLHKEGESYHGHLEVPATLPADSAVWIEIEDAAAATSRASVAF